MASRTQSAAALTAIPSVELPHNLEAEQALLGALMIDNRLIEQVQLLLKPDHLFEPLHARLYEAILKLVDRNMLANPVTLAPLFKSDPAYNEVGGMAYLANLTAATPALIGVKDFAAQLFELAQLRELIRVGRGMVEQALEPQLDLTPGDLIQDAEMSLYKVAEAGEPQGATRSFKDAAKAAIEAVERARKAGGNLSGVTTGLVALNNKLSGLQRSDLIILAGRPGMGKTALATNIAFAAAYRRKQDGEESLGGAGVGFFSLEMSADQLASRVLSEQANITAEHLRRGSISGDDFYRLAQAAQDLEDLPLYIDDTPGLTIAALRTRARRMKRRFDIGAIVVDYLQLLQGSGKGSGDNRVQEISEISRGLKTLAKELNLPVLALSQLSRAVESREDKRPQLSDLRESGSIEQDADIVLFVFREEYYHAQKKPEEDSDRFQKWLEKGERIRGRAEVMVAKNRHGATGTVHLHFAGETTKFSDLADDAYLPERH